MGWAELAVCALVGFFVFGPERLPTVARDAARTLNKFRATAQGFRDEITEGLPDKAALGLDRMSDIRDLHPRRIVTRALFDETGGRATADGQPIATPTGFDDVVATAAPVPRSLPAATPVAFVPPYDVDAT